ncbi:MAG: [protein-PII] uridylyltransferase [Deltaproteobacteria bacterium]|nr:[protein-PII] uridylyltransferase [Deltaproteobacteria bacterium]
MDRFVRSLFVLAGLETRPKEPGQEPFAAAALGGYGRRELCLHSDVDLLIIHQGRLPTDLRKIISRAIYPLWDARLEVGHSILTVPEAIRLALSDFRVFTALIDTRFLLGSRRFYRVFREAFWARIYRERSSLLERFLIYQREREDKYHTEAYFVEPDIKDGLGGLRDLHIMAWMARVYFRSRRLREMERFAAFSHFEFNKLGHSRIFLLKLRNHLHLLTGRKEDQILLASQRELSRLLGYEDGPHIDGPEKLMRDLYLHMNRVRYGHDEFMVKVLDMIRPLPAEQGQDRITPEFQVIKGNVVLGAGAVSEKDPAVILRALKEANQRGFFLGSGFIWEAKQIISIKGEDLLRSREARQLFIDIILRPENPKIIRLMLEMGLITLFIPEFRRIRNLAQFGFYHVRTVDLHLLKTLDVVYRISKGNYDDHWPLLKQVFKDIERPERLFLAALLHDIGKGRGGNHAGKGSELIPGIFRRLDMGKEVADTVSFLIAHHLFLVNISQQRDLGDEKTSVQAAQVIQGRDLLRMLFLLSVADSFSTGQMARTEWKILLLTELFMKVMRILERGILASRDATEEIAAKKQALFKVLIPRFPEEKILDLMDQVSSRYFLHNTVEDMGLHFQMALTPGDDRHAWHLQKLPVAPVTRIIQCARDKPGLFSKMAGVFTLHNMKILSAHIFTLKNGLAFDIYEVTNPLDPLHEAKSWDRARRDLSLALDDRLPLDELIREKGSLPYSGGFSSLMTGKVRVNNEVSDFFTVIEVTAGWRLSLIYDLAKKMFALELDIRFARINSDKEKTTGSFYVRDFAGQKIYEDKQMERMRNEILEVLEHGYGTGYEGTSRDN